jgi:hypothetical protein
MLLELDSRVVYSKGVGWSSNDWSNEGVWADEDTEDSWRPLFGPVCHLARIDNKVRYQARSCLVLKRSLELARPSIRCCSLCRRSIKALGCLLVVDDWGAACQPRSRAPHLCTPSVIRDWLIRTPSNSISRSHRQLSWHVGWSWAPELRKMLNPVARLSDYSSLY